MTQVILNNYILEMVIKWFENIRYPITGLLTNAIVLYFVEVYKAMIWMLNTQPINQL